MRMSQGNASSSRFNDIKRLETEPESLLELKDAIIELYLAIKIRSTEEVSQLNTSNTTLTNLDLPLLSARLNNGPNFGGGKSETRDGVWLPSA